MLTLAQIEVSGRPLTVEIGLVVVLVGLTLYAVTRPSQRT